MRDAGLMAAVQKGKRLRHFLRVPAPGAGTVLSNSAYWKGKKPPGNARFRTPGRGLDGSSSVYRNSADFVH